MTNIDRYKTDLDSLLDKGNKLHNAMQAECFPREMDSALIKEYGDKADEIKKALPSFASTYQSWYSEAKALIRQLLPDRLSDFVRHYEKPKPRKDITYENYRIEDYLQGPNVTRGYEKAKVVGPDAAIPHF